MTPLCIRCQQPIPQGTLAEPVMTRQGMRAEHPVVVGSTQCQIEPDAVDHLSALYEKAEANPFPPYRKFAKSGS